MASFHVDLSRLNFKITQKCHDNSTPTSRVPVQTKPPIILRPHLPIRFLCIYSCRRTFPLRLKDRIASWMRLILRKRMELHSIICAAFLTYCLHLLLRAKSPEAVVMMMMVMVVVVMMMMVVVVVVVISVCDSSWVEIHF